MSDTTVIPHGHLEWNVEPLDRSDLLPLLSDDETALPLERHLARAARTQGALELAIGEGLAALSVGDRAMRLGWSSVKDYGRELLDVSDRTVLELAHLARELRARPLLRAAVRAGEVSLRSARTVLRVAIGDDEARWVALARQATVRALEEAVRGGTDPDDGDDWDEMVVPLGGEGREVVDEALALAGSQLGRGSTRAQRLEALAQEFLGSHPGAAPEDAGRPILGGPFRRLTGRPSARLEALKARLERETARWCILLDAEAFFAVGAGLDEDTAPQRIDARLKELASMRREWDRQVGYLALVVKRSGLWRLLGFASFAHYCSERLSLGVRTVEQRAAFGSRAGPARAANAS